MNTEALGFRDTHTRRDAVLHPLERGASASVHMYAGKSEYVQGLTLDECATLLNVDANDASLMGMINDTAFAIKNRIYGNRIVLFAPLYIANYCVNSCTYCAFRAGNKKLAVRMRAAARQHFPPLRRRCSSRPPPPS